MALDDRRVVFTGDYTTCAAEVSRVSLVELLADLFTDDLATSQDRHVLEHRLPTITEAGRLDREDTHGSAELVNHERCESLALDVLGHDDDALRDLERLLERREDFVDRRNLLVSDDDQRIIKRGFHTIRIGHEVRGYVSAIELHALDVFGLVLDAPRFLDRDDAVLPNLFHNLGDQAANLSIGGRDGRHLSDLLAPRDRGRNAPECRDGCRCAAVDPALEHHWVGSGGHVLHTFVNDGLG